MKTNLLQILSTALILCLVTSCSSDEKNQAAEEQIIIAPPESSYTPVSIDKLRESPRLFASDIETLNTNLRSPYLKDLAKRVLLDADTLVESDPVTEGEANSYLRGSRQMRSNLRTLTGAWALTHDAKYRQAAMRYLNSLMTWNHISCEARSTTPPDRQLFFCLTYGEQAAEIGIMYDIFRPDITPEEKKIFFDVLERFHMKEALRSLRKPPWWVNKEWSNWNGVCAGGMGIMALAFYDDIPEARKLIPFVEESLRHYFRSFITNGGGCHEGTGYWNYGMTYAANYLLFWENSTGRKHPAFEIEEIGKSLHFPLDFQGLNFGDNDGWGPMGFYFRLAERMDEPGAAAKAATKLPTQVNLNPRKPKRFWNSASPDLIYAGKAIPSPETVEALIQAHSEQKAPLARVYDGLGWAILADDEVVPSLRLAARGGSSEVRGHGMLDLMSFKCRLNGKLMITDQTDGYNAVTFTGRGTDQYGRSAASKSTLFVDGLGCAKDVECRSTELVGSEDILGIRIDGSGIYMPHWRRKMFIGRLFLMIENRYWLVLDRVHSRDRADRHWVESRFLTFASHERGDDWIRLNMDNQQMMMSFKSLKRAVIQESKAMPIAPKKQATVIRWMGSSPSADNLHVTALNPGTNKLDLAIAQETQSGNFTITVSGANGYQREVRVTPRLTMVTEQKQQ